MSRRKWIAGAGATAIALLGGYAIKRMEHVLTPDTPANKFLCNFPETLNGAGQIKKHCTPGARYCLVHVLQEHERIDVGMTPRALETQNDIECILSELVTQPNVQLRSCYLESICDPKVVDVYMNANVTQDMNSFIRQLPERTPQKIEELRKIVEDLENIERKDRGGHAPQLPQYRAELHYLETGDAESYYTAVQNENRKRQQKDNERMGALRVARKYRDTFKLLPAETYTSCQDAGEVVFKSLKEGRSFKDNPLVFKNREDMALNLMIKDGGDFGVVVFGAVHTFNVSQWNAEHPDCKISLIEIVPTALTREFKR